MAGKWAALQVNVIQDQLNLEQLIQEMGSLEDNDEFSAISRLMKVRQTMMDERWFVLLVENHIKVDIYLRQALVMLRVIKGDTVPWRREVVSRWFCFRDATENRKHIGSRVVEQMGRWGSASFKFSDITRQDGSTLRARQRKRGHAGNIDAGKP